MSKEEVFQAYSDAVFVDFEASGLGKDSWPIEIGLSTLSPQLNIKTRSTLIRPHPSWDMDAWDEEAEEVHGLSLEELHRDGLEPAEVARMYLKELEDKRIFVTSTKHDSRWMHKLMETIGAQDFPFRIECFVNHIYRDFSYEELETILIQESEEFEPVHRAGADTDIMARQILTMMDQRHGFDIQNERELRP